MKSLYHVPAGNRLTVTADGVPAYAAPLDDPSAGMSVPSSMVFGPFGFSRTFEVSGGVGVVAQDATVVAHLITSGDGAPDDAAQAAIAVNPTGDDNGLTFTAVEYGVGGNALSVTYVDPGANDAALSVVVAGPAIVVRLATGGAGAITSTAAEVAAAVAASIPAARLVTADIDTTDSGTADDGSGVVTAMARTALADGAGTGIGASYPGALYIDTTNGNVYRNSGTRAAPAWTQLADAA